MQPVLPAGSRPVDFIAVGENSLDLFCVLREFPRPDEKVRAEQVIELSGGQAATAAVACARLGWRSRYVGAFGADRAAAVIRQSLSREHVDVRAIVKDAASTRSAVIVVEQSSGRRTVIESRDPALTVAEHEIGAEVLSSARVMLVDGSDPALSLRALRIARDTGCRTLLDVDVVTDDALELARNVDVAIVPHEFAREATGEAERGTALEALGRNLGAAVVVSTAAADGALAWTPAGELRVEARRTDVVDTTGAGDAFRAGFAAAWLSSAGEPPDLFQILTFAVEVAAWNCRTLGAQAGLPTPADLQFWSFNRP